MNASSATDMTQVLCCGRIHDLIVTQRRRGTSYRLLPRHARKGDARMVYTTLDFAEQYLLHTEVVMSSDVTAAQSPHRGTDGSIADGVIASQPDD